MTDEQRVKAVYPDAKIARDHHSAYYLFTKQGAGGRISEYVGSEELAWKSAASKLPEPTPPTETREVLSDYAVGLIADGLELPYVWVVRKMAQEIRDRRAAEAPRSQEDGNV